VKDKLQKIMGLILIGTFILLKIFVFQSRTEEYISLVIMGTISISGSIYTLVRKPIEKKIRNLHIRSIVAIVLAMIYIVSRMVRGI